MKKLLYILLILFIPSVLFSFKLTGGNFRTFQPNDIPDCELWLDASDINTVTLQGGTTYQISQWDDKSGNGNNATQAVSENQPSYIENVQNNLSVVRFDGIDNFLRANGVTPVCQSTHTIFIAMNISGTASNLPAIIGWNIDIETYLCRNDGYFLHYDGDFVELINDVDVRVDPWIFTLRASNNTIIPYYNGVLKNSYADSLQIATDFSIGMEEDGGATPGNYYYGDLYEIIIYSRDLSPSQRQQVENYLLNKWGI